MKYLVHCSNSNLGGAEKSVCEQFLTESEKKSPLFLLPESGVLSEYLTEINIPFKILPWPPGLERFSQRQLNVQWLYCFLLPIFFIPWFKYLFKFRQLINQSELLFSSGIKSHCICLLISITTKKKIVFNIRDFIEPIWFKIILSRLCKMREITIEANSKAVGNDYFKPNIKYPIIKTNQNKQQHEKKKSPLIISHVAYFCSLQGARAFSGLREKNTGPRNLGPVFFNRRCYISK